MVNKGNKCLGSDCLARFDLHLDEFQYPMSNFITSRIPVGFTSLGPEEYILVGQWTPQMFKQGRVPKFEEVHQYYNPGHMSYFFYLISGSNKKRGRIRVNQQSYSPQCKSIPQIIRGALLDPLEHSRVVIAEDRAQLDDVIKAAQDQSLTAIEMEPTF
jgi:hypothetical protein